MDSERGMIRHLARSGNDEEASAPPPPPPPRREEANGGHRRGQRRRRRWPRARGVVLAVAVMITAAMYLLFAEDLAVPPPSAPWFFTAFSLWILGTALLFRFMN